MTRVSIDWQQCGNQADAAGSHRDCFALFCQQISTFHALAAYLAQLQALQAIAST